MELKLRLMLVTTSQVDGWTKAKSMLNSTQYQVEVVDAVGVVCIIAEVILYFPGWVGGWVAGGIDHIALSSFN